VERDEPMIGGVEEAGINFLHLAPLAGRGRDPGLDPGERVRGRN